MKKGVYVFWSLLIAAAVLRLVLSFSLKPPDLSACVKRDVSGEGVVAEEPTRTESGQTFVVETYLCGEYVNVRIKTKAYPRFSYGDAVLFSGKLSQPLNFKSDSGRSFDYRGYLAKDDVFYEMKSANVSKVDTATEQGDTKEVKKNVLYARLYSLRRGFVSNLEQVLGEPHAALAAGLVVGEKSALGKDLLNDFRIVGLIHIVVLSGYNITIVGDALRRLLSFLPRIWGIVIGAIGIVLFGILVGGGATVVRSCFMASLALSADLIRRDYDVTRALAFAALIMLITNPLTLLHDPSFQLSFLATLSLILLAGPVEKRLTFVTERWGIRGIISSTIATQFLVAPYILYMMGSISIIGVVVNILVLPCIPLTMLTVFLSGAAGFVWMPLAQVFGWVAHGLLSYELFMVEHFARIPYAAINVPAFPVWVVWIFYGVFAVTYGTVFLKSKKAATTSVLSQRLSQRLTN